MSTNGHVRFPLREAYSRYVRNNKEKRIEKQATRLAPISIVTTEMLQQIIVDDISEL